MILIALYLFAAFVTILIGKTHGPQHDKVKSDTAFKSAWYTVWKCVLVEQPLIIDFLNGQTKKEIEGAKDE